MDQTDVTIRQIMADVFNIPAEEITEQSSQDTIEEWDSLKHLDLVVALEEEFAISIPVEEIGTMVSFKLVSFIIKELINQ